MRKDMIGLIISVVFIFLVIIFGYKEPRNNKFIGLEPKATYNGYKIYDLVEQKQLACAEAIEILDSDLQYQYYFTCLKSDQIYLVKDDEVIRVKNAYKAGLIPLNALYELDIVDRMEKINE